LSHWNVLAPVELSSGPQSIRHAVALARELRADVDLLHVVPEGAVGAVEAAWPSAAHSKPSNVEVRRSTLVGATATTVAAYADRIDAELIIMTSYISRWTRVWRRSIKEQVFHISARPVCVTSARQQHVVPTLENCRVLCLLDLQSTDLPLLAHARQLVDRIGAHVILLHVLAAAIPSISDGVLQPYDELSVATAHDRLLQLADTAGLHADTSVMVGPADECIVRAAQEHRAGLIIATRFPALARRRHPTSLHNLLPQLCCPLVTVPNRMQVRNASRRLTSIA
jgi:nucleotide-binding universal stress UspA family protein